MLYWICEKSATHPLNWQALEYAIRRNFGGLDEFDPLVEFRKRISLPCDATIDNFQVSIIYCTVPVLWGIPLSKFITVVSM